MEYYLLGSAVCISFHLSLEIAFKYGIMYSLKLVQVGATSSYSYVFNIIHLVAAINSEHLSEKWAEWTALKFVSLFTIACNLFLT